MTTSHLDRLHEHLTSAISEPVLREALTRLWYMNDQIRQVQGDASMRLRQRVVIEQVLCERLCAQWQSASRSLSEKAPGESSIVAVGQMTGDNASSL
jgi:hypothetical protein